VVDGARPARDSRGEEGNTIETVEFAETAGHLIGRGVARAMLTGAQRHVVGRKAVGVHISTAAKFLFDSAKVKLGHEDFNSRRVVTAGN
jgi:hypothetical protein